MNIQLHIERLILEDLPISRAQGPQVQAAVEAELARLLTQNGIAPTLASGGALRSVSAEAIEIAPKSEAATLGYQIAGAVHGGLNR